MSTRIRGYGLENLICGVTPTYSGWDTDPTTGANTVDGDPDTICDTGTLVATAWESAYFEWNLGKNMNVSITGLGFCETTTGTAYIRTLLYTSGAWRIPTGYTTTSQHDDPFVVFGGLCERIRLSFMPAVDATINPHIRDVAVWRMNC